ncbi:MAG: riboflavin synthase [Ignavibacteria bacterium]|nr:riboflavin synthase [Ignavibacteria bacterium]MBT8380830.1 riboflavin synthase [Ignavibacteria bacterium]MBT8393022.1 riboflavin synthase [Ignavibacteria bacterium]NNJ52124.1 riboflavin synthase [Ignavibacteriaceae bacterium]NNL19807.1 riboflavin synthase [Ignavibacteriaceae bacterium]
MFTGIIEEIGKIDKTQPIAGGISLKIEAKKIIEDISVNDSICIDGVCLTATKLDDSAFWVDAVGATLEKSTFVNKKSSKSVNLERSVKLNDRLGGHLVQGHINGIGIISEIKKLGENYLLKISLTSDLEKYLVKEGSIAINGISLTIADVHENQIALSVIPHTWQNTTLKYNQVNDKVNIEVDILAKYVERLLSKNNGGVKNNISENWLKELGY